VHDYPFSHAMQPKGIIWRNNKEKKSGAENAKQGRQNKSKGNKRISIANN
jgi:hypothetical protein